MMVSVIIPVYNECGTILQVIDAVQKVPLPNIKKEIIIVDDGSSDGTTELLQKKVHMSNVHIFYHAQNKGKGSAIRTAIPHTTGDIILIQDADLELDPTCYPSLLEPIISKKTTVVYGARFLKNPPKISLISKLANYAVTTTTNILYGANITDEAAGYKVFQSDVLKSIPLQCERFEFCPEITAKVCKRGYRIVEVPVLFRPRSRAEGKKIGWRDGFQALWVLVKYRFIN